MPRIKIKGLPKMRKYALGGDNNCPEGYRWNEFNQQCEPDPDYSPNEYQPAQQKIGSSTFPVGKQSSGSGNMWANFGNNISNMANEDARQVNGLLNPGMFNPFDVKWGQEQVNPNINFTGNYSNDPLNRYATSSADSRFATPTLSNTPMGGKGVLNTAALTLPEASSSTTGKKKKSGNALSDIANSLGWGTVGLGVAGAMANRFDIMNRQKEYDKYARQSRLPDNYYAVNTTQDRGDYDINDGMFRPNQLGFKSKGMFANPYYAQRNFVRYGGMMKAADGMSIPGTEMVQQAVLPDLPAINFTAPRTASAPSAPKAAPSYQGEDVKGSLKDVIAAKESGGNYRALPKKKDGTLASSAVGKYQFLWNQHKNWISEVTGVNTKEGFMNSPEAQEQAFEHWDKNILTPQAQKIKKELGVNIPLNNIKYSIHFAGPQGAYNYFKTGRETVDAFGTNVSKITKMKLSQEGGQNNNNMKIRIVGIPDEESQMAYGGQPPYSGQSDYGLYVGQRNLYKTMAKNPYKDNKNTVSEKEPSANDPFVLEAEGGETIYRPDGTHMEITGKRHSQGGEKLTKSQAPEGSFIYSDTQKLKIKDPEVLKMFGKGGAKGITPATIAKQYETNKYLAILQDPNADKLAKDTARRMVDNYERKLAELALVQESMKGFPQGIPDIAKGIMMAAQGPTIEQGMQEQELTAKYGGGLRKFVDAGPVDPVSLLWNPTGQAQPYPQVPGPYDPNNPMPNIPDWYTPWLKSNTKKGSISPTGQPTTFDPSNPNKFYSDYNYWKNTIGRDFSSPEDLQGSIYDYIQAQDPAALDKMWQTWGPTAKGDKRKGFVDKYFGARTADVMGWRKPDTTPRQETTPKSNMTVKPGVIDEGTTPAKPGAPTVPGGDPQSAQNMPAGWTSQDIRNLGNAAMDYSTLKKYHPYYSTIQPVLPEMVPVDWRGYAASLQSGANAAAQQLGTYQPGQSMAANLSQLAGQQAEGLGKYISDTDRANAGAAANVSAQRANILNQFTQYNAALRDKAADEENVYDDRYRAAERLGRKGIVKAMDQGEDTASKIYNENMTQKYYKINPYTQRMQFNDDDARAAWEAATRGGYQEGSAGQNQALSIYNSVYEQVKGSPEQRHEVALSAMKELLGGGGSRQSTTEYPYAPTKNRTTKTKPAKYGGSTKPGYSYYNPFLK